MLVGWVGNVWVGGRNELMTGSRDTASSLEIGSLSLGSAW